jgi:WD40 repeat protein
MIDNEAFLNEDEKAAKQAIQEIKLNFEKELETFKSNNSDHENDSYEKFATIQRQMDIHRDEIKLAVCKRIDEIFFKMTKQAEEKQAAIAKIQTETYKKIVNSDLNQITETIMEQFRQPNLTMDTLHKLKGQQEEAIKTIQSQIDKFRSQIDDVNSFDFTKGSIILNENHFGFINLDKQSSKAISCSSDKTIKIWDLETNECVKTLQGHGGRVYGLEKIDLNRVVSCSEDKLIKVWDIQNGTCLQTLIGHDDGIGCVKVLPHDFLASGSYKVIKIWSLQNGTCVKTLVGHTCFVKCLIVFPNGSLVSCSQDKTIKVWDLEQGTCTQTLQGHTDVVYCLLLLSNGHLASGSKDKSIKIWDLETGRCVTTLVGHANNIWSLEQAVNNELISCSYDKTIKNWSLDSGNCIATLVGHIGAVASIKKYQDDNLISCGTDKTIRIWDTITKQCIKTIKTDHTDTIRHLILF